MAILHIDTRDNKNVVAKLDIDGKIIEANSMNEDRRPESIVNLIAAVCEKAGIRGQDVTGKRQPNRPQQRKQRVLSRAQSLLATAIYLPGPQ